ncbi:hypothetical protein HHL11_32055 [Ramlibacter sp. G-1-2-2]|uniref:Uncharacterized protein n=1 Tax=Ramlibacter agri TaxID=2728837 RepID=A0A848HD84_9BURK|nr:hypothetical protein [Ramlibacter agri]NML48424.1 hypothetical protein [Ramlibacter agri]
MICTEDAERVAAAPNSTGIRHPFINGWSVVGHDRIVGAAHNRPGEPDGKTIITSPVVQIRFMGARKSPVAFTASGSAYWLGEPAASFGPDQAESFLWFKSRQRPAAAGGAAVDPALQTQVMKLA